MTALGQAYRRFRAADVAATSYLSRAHVVVSLPYLDCVTGHPVALRPILAEDIEQVASFLNEHLNSRLPASRWAAAMRTSWDDIDSPNHGYMLLDGEAVVGVNLAFYSSRDVGASVERVCNLAALCVREDYRGHAVRLVRALLKQRDFTFTDLSPSGNVVAMDERLGFNHLDTLTIARPNGPTRVPAGVEVLTDPSQVESVLTGRDLRIFRDHQRCLAARHVALRVGDRVCYVIFRIDRRKRLRLFASLLYVSDAAVYGEFGKHLGWFLLRIHKAPITLIESRLIDYRPVDGVQVRLAGRPKMFKSRNLGATEIDYLYSELTCVPW